MVGIGRGARGSSVESRGRRLDVRILALLLRGWLCRVWRGGWRGGRGRGRRRRWGRGGLLGRRLVVISCEILLMLLLRLLLCRLFR